MENDVYLEQMECNLDTGFPIENDDMVECIENQPSIQCLKYENKFVKLVTKNKKINNKALIYKNQFMPDGVYTYLINEFKDIYATPVDNRLEINCKHMFIAHKTNSKYALAAGEMYVKGSVLTFNLLSGTYMKPYMIDLLKGKCNEAIINRTREILMRRFTSFRIDYTDKEIITDRIVPITRDNLNKYVRAGYEVRLYDDVKDCTAIPEVHIARLELYKRMKLPPTDNRYVETEKILNHLNSSIYTLYTGGKRRSTRKKLRRRF